MEIVILESVVAVAELVADSIARLVRTTTDPVLGLATGNSPLGVYAELIRRHRQEGLSFAHCHAFLLDEYIGLPADHRESYRSFIRKHLTDHIDIAPIAVNVPDGNAADPQAACAAYERSIAAAGGIDMQLLGIGRDGHLGFNEPTSSLASRTRVKTLTDETRIDNSRFFESPEAVPRHVVTQGIGTILQARHLVLVATGEAKSAPVAAAVEGPLTSMIPASAMQLHPHATVVIDEAAASRLRLYDYYRSTWAAKPAWQHI
jgi:glucosamine-6-phosphate deaminase